MVYKRIRPCCMPCILGQRNRFFQAFQWFTESTEAIRHTTSTSRRKQRACTRKSAPRKTSQSEWRLARQLKKGRWDLSDSKVLLANGNSSRRMTDSDRQINQQIWVRPTGQISVRVKDMGSLIFSGSIPWFGPQCRFWLTPRKDQNLFQPCQSDCMFLSGVMGL